MLTSIWSFKQLIITIFSFTFECSVNSDVVVACFDEFSKTLKGPSVVILDNAPIHHSEVFENEIKKWEGRGLFLYYLPKYSPELNLIEILWKHIKYYWISLSAYASFDALRKELNGILANVGTSYKIVFT